MIKEFLLVVLAVVLYLLIAGVLGNDQVLENFF